MVLVLCSFQKSQLFEQLAFVRGVCGTSRILAESS